MGLNAPYLRFIEASIDQVYPDNSNRGLKMLELGDQVIVDSAIPEKTGKDYFLNRGFDHTSVDINGLHGAVIRDLTRPEEFQDWHSTFDVLTNAGTTEHVEPFDKQYECFQILHSCVKVGGVMMHLVPDVFEHDMHGAWKGHCRFYYSADFFEQMAKVCGYDVLESQVINRLRCVALRKTIDIPFVWSRCELLSLIAQRDQISGSDRGILVSRLGRLRSLGFFRR